MALIQKKSYFPVAQKAISLDELINCHKNAVYATDKRSNQTELHYYSRWGKELELQQKMLPKGFRIEDPNLLAEYQRIQKHFAEQSQGRGETEKALLACQCHKSFMESVAAYAKEKFADSPEMLQKFSAVSAYIQKNAQEFESDFVHRTSIPMKEVLDACAAQKRQDIARSDLSAEEKEATLRFVDQEFAALYKAFAKAFTEPSSDEKLDPKYIYSAKHRQDNIDAIVQACSSLHAFFDKDNMKATEYPLEKDRVKIATNHAKLISVMQSTPNELNHARQGEFGFDGKRIKEQFTFNPNNNFVKELLEPAEYERFQETVFHSENGYKIFCKHVASHISNVAPFYKTGNTYPSVADIKKLNIEKIASQSDISEAFVKSLQEYGFTVKPQTSDPHVSQEVAYENVANLVQ